MTERTTILIVDDESKIRRLLSRSLETEGFDVAVADSAMSASEFLNLSLTPKSLGPQSAFGFN